MQKTGGKMVQQSNMLKSILKQVIIFCSKCFRNLFLTQMTQQLL